jgi:hypothetical protein
MIADAHAHIGRHLGVEGYARELKSAGIRTAAVFADPESPTLAADNPWVLGEARRRGWIPFLYVGGNAYADTRPWPEVRLPDDLDDFAGVKWHCHMTPGHDSGGWEMVSPDEARRGLEADDVAGAFAAFERLALPVIFEEAYEITLRAVSLYPGVTFIIPHLGMLNGGAERVVAAIGSRPNVLFDTSLAVPPTHLVARLGADRFLFGSDHPYGSPRSGLEGIRALGLPGEDEGAILGGNLARLLGPKWPLPA